MDEAGFTSPYITINCYIYIFCFTLHFLSLKMKNKEAVFNTFYTDLKTTNALGAEIALRYGKRSKAIGEKLVADNVAHNADDVNTVMLTGFFHAYGPINNYFD
jgi:hypothetical protein